MPTPRGSSPGLRKAGPHHIHVQSKILTNLYKLAASVADVQDSHYSKSGSILLNVYHLSRHSYRVSQEITSNKNVYEWINHFETSSPAQYLTHCASRLRTAESEGEG